MACRWPAMSLPFVGTNVVVCFGPPPQASDGGSDPASASSSESALRLGLQQCVQEVHGLSAGEWGAVCHKQRCGLWEATVTSHADK